MKKNFLLFIILLLSFSIFGCSLNKKDNKEEEVKKEEVKDTEAPVITGKEKFEVYAGEKIDLLKDVSATDNETTDVKVTVEGEYNVNKVGEYSLKYVATDESGNKAEKEFKLVVKKKPETNNNNNNNNNTSNSNTFISTGTDSSLNGTTTSKGYTITVKNGVAYVDGVLIANKTYALPSSYNPGGLLSETLSAFNTMKSAAALSGINISVASGFRSYDYQKKLYSNYVSKYGKADADLGSARPGHSEHQTGLAFDLNTINDSSANTTTSKWVLSNCYKYGFILRYPSGKTNETGYKYEWWHLRYVGVDLATKLYNGGDWITLESYYGLNSKYSY